MTNTKQSNVQSKASYKWARLKPVFASQKLAGFADKAVFVDSASMQTRDGFSFDVLSKSVLQSAYSANVPAQKYRDGTDSINQPVTAGRNERGSELGTRYRYIDETPLVPMTEAGKANSTNATASASGAKTRSRPNNEYVLYSYGEPVAMSADGNASYFGTDILGSVRNVTDKYGTVQADYSYDAFGSPYLGNLENDIGFGYCGKVYDNGTGLYDYGFRDYSPVSARFTTVDPIRDGSNWFSYVVNDPVNYYDQLGLETAILKDIKETLSDLKSAIANLLFPGEITNETSYELFPRAESNKITADLLKNSFIIPQNTTLSEALANNHDVSYKQIALDGLVLPDKSVYKGWSGSKITVTETKNEAGETSFVVIESFGTKLINGIINLGRNFFNNFRSEKNQKDLYGYYTKTEVEALKDKPSDNVSAWIKTENVPEGYFEQMKGCTK